MSESPVIIAVDAMGGDFAPEATVKGAVDTARDPGCDFAIRLFGDEQLLRPLLSREGGPAALEVIHCSETIGMNESATGALKTKRDSSIVRMLEAQRDGEVDGCISAGNTGAVMAASTLILGRLRGVARPTIGAFFPNMRGWTLVVDAGANVDCKPQHLLQFGLMGSVFAGQIFGLKKPSVGLLNVGEEEGKGNETAVEAHRLMKKAPMNFVGNIEGRDILKGNVDVAVCDGFTGNILLKFAESFPVFLKTKFRDAARRGLRAKLAVGLAAGTLRTMMKEWDYQEQGGVPLLGVNGVSIIGHGSSTPAAIRSMILKAKEMIDRRVNERIAEALSASFATE